MTDLSGHDRKVTSDKKIIFIPCEVYNSGNRDYCSHFSVALETTGKFLIVFVRLILGKVGFDGFTEPRRESDIRYEFDLRVVLKSLEWFLRPFLTEIPTNN